MSEHLIRVRDMRLRFGAPEVFAAQCSCGWLGEEHRGRTGERTALLDGRHHVEATRPTRSVSPPSVPTSP